MTQRERYLAMGVGVVVGLFGVNFAFTTVRDTLQHKQDLVDTARKESDSMKRIATSGTLAARKLDQLKTKSLPTTQEILVAQYKAWLTKAALEAGMSDIKVTTPEQPLKSTPAYKVYRFSLTGSCRIEECLELLATYYDTDYLHTLQSFKLTMTKVPNVVQISLDSQALALDVAAPKQEPSGESSGRLAMTAEEYKQKILGRNPFAPPNQAPKLAIDKSHEIHRGTTWEQIVKTEDVENHDVDVKLVSSEVPEGLQLNGKTFKWSPQENGTYEILLQATDRGWPRASTEQKLTLNVVDPPKAEEPAPPPVKFDAASQAFLSALLSGRSGPEAWIRSRVEGKTVELSEGSEFEIGTVKAKVVGINLNEDFVEMESEGVRWTIGMDTSLADAYARSKID